MRAERRLISTHAVALCVTAAALLVQPLALTIHQRIEHGATGRCHSAHRHDSPPEDAPRPADSKPCDACQWLAQSMGHLWIEPTALVGSPAPWSPAPPQWAPSPAQVRPHRCESSRAPPSIA